MKVWIFSADKFTRTLDKRSLGNTESVGLWEATKTEDND